MRESDPAGERWSDRAKQGKQWTAGYRRQHVTEADLRTFLLSHCNNVGATLAAKLDSATVGERSDLAGNLMQCLMFNAHKLPCGWSADFYEKCRYVMAYWMVAESYGKAGEKGYSQEKDGWSLIAQIVHEDALLKGGKWACPFWAKGQGTAAPKIAIEPEPPARPAHRPKGDQEKHLATFRRVLEAIVPDEWGRRVYTLDYLADKMAAAHCRVKTRTIQGYLKILRAADEIATAQISGNGKPYALLKSCFGGANKSAKPDKPTPPASDRGSANKEAIERVTTPQTPIEPPQCIEDHHNPSVPPSRAAVVAEAIDAHPGVLPRHRKALARLCCRERPARVDSSAIQSALRGRTGVALARAAAHNV